MLLLLLLRLLPQTLEAEKARAEMLVIFIGATAAVAAALLLLELL